MKKLMIAAASAAVGLGAFAVYTPEAYEMCITLKTTTCKAGEGKNVCDEGYTTYRVKATQKITGLIWGCDCPTIAEPKAFESFDDFGTENACHGYVFWDATDKSKNPYETATFAWEDAAGTYSDFLQCINPKCNECEGLWTLALADSDGEAVASLQGAGFGSACWNSDYLAAYVKSMSGNVTGWAFPGYLSYGCAACGESKTGCSAWAFCTACDERDDTYPSIAYGTFTLKFKSDVAKKYAKGTTGATAIFNAYKFSDAVKAYLVKVDAGESTKTGVVDQVTKYYNTCKAAVADAEEDVLTTSNAWVEASYYNRQVQGNSYSTLKEVGETLTKGEQYQKAYAAIVTAYEKKIEDSGCDIDDDFTNVIYTSFNDYAPLGDETAKRAAFEASDLYKYAAAYAACAATWGQETISAAYGKFEYETKQITAQQYKEWYTDDVKDAQNALVNAKADFVKAIEVYTCADMVQQAKDKAAFETYYAAYNTLIEDYAELEADWTYNENMYEQSWQYNDEGVALTTAEIEALQKEAAEDATAATKAYTEAKTAQDDLATAETACLITKGNKECK